MIVNYTGAGWEIVTQRAHGLLAAQIAMRWRKDERPERWLETLIAVAEHDDGELEVAESALLTPEGGPLNFAQKNFDLQTCLSLSDQTITKSRYIALLTSFHLDFLYKPFAKKDRPARTFLKAQKKLRTKWMRELDIKANEIEKIYSFMEWCDALSLLICQHQVQPENRRIEISTDSRKRPYFLQRIDKKSVTVEPWPFEESAFEMNYESRLIRRLRFKDPKEFRTALKKAKVSENRILFKKKPRGLREPSKIKRPTVQKNKPL